MLDAIVELADIWTETSYNLEATCSAGGSDAFIWQHVLCPIGEGWHLAAALTYLVLLPLCIVGILLAPAVLVLEFCRLKRSMNLLSSARAAIVAGFYSLMFFLPYLLHRFKGGSCFRDGRIASYVGIHLFWLFGAGIIWIYNLANKNWIFLEDPQIRYRQLHNEEIITSIAVIVLLFACAYSFIYLWCKHRQEIEASFSIAPFIFALVWFLLGLPECSFYWENRRNEEYETLSPYYYLTLPVIFASIAWIGYTSIKLWRARPGTNPPAASTPETGTPASSGSSTSDAPTPRSTNPDVGRGDS